MGKFKILKNTFPKKTRKSQNKTITGFQGDKRNRQSWFNQNFVKKTEKDENISASVLKSYYLKKKLTLNQTISFNVRWTVRLIFNFTKVNFFKYIYIYIYFFFFEDFVQEYRNTTLKTNAS